jgi:hypothetical protein
MPYPNEHAARQRSPGGYKEFRRTHPKGWPSGIDAVLGIRSSGGSEIQSIRFSSSEWNAEDAKKWLKEHGFTSSGFEAATKKAIDQNVRSVSGKFEIAKVQPDQQLVFGWLYVAVKADGTQVVDNSGEIVAPDTLEKASYEYVLSYRKGCVMHEKDLDGETRQIGRLVECVVFTAQKRAAMNIPDGIIGDAIWVGYKIDDPATWTRIKSGELRMLSFGGLATVRPVREAA